MNFILKISAILVSLAVFLLPVSVTAQTSQFETMFIESAEYCVSSTDDACEELVLSNISQVRGASQDEQYDFELTTFASSIADVWDDGMSLSVCSRLADALIEISESVESDSLASNIAILAVVVRDCEGISILADELLALASDN
jgi:hypothetical protein